MRATACMPGRVCAHGHARRPAVCVKTTVQTSVPILITAPLITVKGQDELASSGCPFPRPCLPQAIDEWTSSALVPEDKPPFTFSTSLIFQAVLTTCSNRAARSLSLISACLEQLSLHGSLAGDRDMERRHGYLYAVLDHHPLSIAVSRYSVWSATFFFFFFFNACIS